ncbi:hypothetical protein OG992_31560 [Micromonospora sp. NBC_00362]|uniref:hypothetical protein n=1 Tax=Micromonospora sp. NBC_00362 TaxID=2975975 RepID=UPI00224C9AC9|nr:hypothetical protein [Micromonospora sp. NBC_00362]MCX5121723.1 hypothetical protein [Micromonospora sp. NBC_00362]
MRGRTGRAAFILTVLIVTAHFGTYTYAAPFRQQVAGAASVTLFLLVSGIGGGVGNFAAGASARRRLRATLITGAVAFASATACCPCSAP